jgi:hypothetical protein
MSFAQKRIEVTINLANGNFSIGGGNTADIAGLRIACHIQAFAAVDQGNMEMAIFGLPLSLMNQLSNVGNRYTKDSPNDILVSAGDDETGMHVVFAGHIYSAYVDARAMPQVAFRIDAKPGYFHQIKPADPISVQGSADVAGLMSQIAGKMGVGFENAGVVAKLANPYFGGTLMMQAAQIAEHAGIEWILDRKTLAIMSPGKPRAGGAVLISPQTGMVGYPQFNENQVIVQTLWNPAIQFGGLVEIKSDLTAACGTWIVRSLDHYLEAQVPRGKWFSIVSSYFEGEATP